MVDSTFDGLCSMDVSRTDVSAAHAQPVRSDVRRARRSSWAGVGMVSILLAVSSFAVWSSHATSVAATQAGAASRLSDDYADAASAVAAEESWERKYRLEPGIDVEDEFDKAAEKFATAMRHVRRDGGAADRALVDAALIQHRQFVISMEVLFRARDRGDEAGVLRADAKSEVFFEQVEDAVVGAAETSHQHSLSRLAYLTHLQNLTRLLTPLVFVIGLLIAALLALVGRGHRRQLVLERAQALNDSLYDPLSGLPNRTLLNDRLDRLLRADARAGTKTGLLLIDLDRFKEVNDTFGHQYGDELLRKIGPRLSGVLREVDTVGRLGGDEFAVLLPAVGTEADACRVAGQLRAALEPSFHIFGVDLNIEASVGVVLSGDHGHEATVLLQRADIAMYAAKAQNLGVHTYSADINQHSPARLALLGELRRALDSRDLVVHYQPKIAISTGRAGRRGGPRPVGPPLARVDLSRRLHPLGRTHRAHRPADSLRPRRSTHPDRGVVREPAAPHGLGEPLSTQSPRRPSA